MNINIYIEDSLAKQLSQCARKIGKTHNTAIHEAIREWIERQRVTTWPNSILDFKGYSLMLPFELAREELLSPEEDPL